MNARRAARLWLLGGVLVIAVLTVATYLLAIKPVYDDKALKQDQIADQDVKLIQLRSKLADLKKQANDIATYTEQLAAKKKQLPDSYDIPNFLRQLQDSDSAVDVDTTSVGVSTPVSVDGSSTVVSVPITLIASGDVDELTSFVKRLQTVQNRAVLLTSVLLTVGDTADATNVNLVLTAFCSKTDDDDCKVAATT